MSPAAPFPFGDDELSSVCDRLSDSEKAGFVPTYLSVGYDVA
jgi:hypothetical protein